MGTRLCPWIAVLSCIPLHLPVGWRPIRSLAHGVHVRMPHIIL
jgi:hypothetical protein